MVGDKAEMPAATFKSVTCAGLSSSRTRCQRGVRRSVCIVTGISPNAACGSSLCERLNL
jgi:hypothetical protein